MNNYLDLYNYAKIIVDEAKEQGLDILEYARKNIQDGEYAIYYGKSFSIYTLMREYSSIYNIVMEEVELDEVTFPIENEAQLDNFFSSFAVETLMFFVNEVLQDEA